MECKNVGFLRTKVLEMMAKYIGIEDLAYVISNIISEERVTEVEYEITNSKLEDVYTLSIKLSKENKNNGFKEDNGRNE
jgi:hypothetical protein